VVAERIGWEHSASVLPAKVAQLRAEFPPAPSGTRWRCRP